MTVNRAAGLDEATVSRRGSRQRPLAVSLLYAFWAFVFVTVGLGAAVLQILGPPQAEVERPFVATVGDEANASPKQAAAVTTAPAGGTARGAATPAPTVASASPGFTPALPAVAPVVVPLPEPKRPPGAIAAPEPGLQEASSLYPGMKLPRVGADRRSPMQIYAAPFNQADPRPRVSVLLAGMGMNENDTLTAIDALPGAISLAFSPYSYRPDVMLRAARTRGHEYLLSIPMEPLGYPLNDPGNRALLTGATMATNAERLEWVMSRFPGYVGATGALGDMRGERFAAATDQMAPVLDSLADRGLLYVDPRPNVARLAGSPAQRGVGRGVDLVLDDPPDRVSIDQKLARLEQLARDRGAAIGLAGRATPLVISRLAVWATTLAAHGVALAPVSVVVQMPQAAIGTPATAVRTNLLR